MKTSGNGQKEAIEKASKILSGANTVYLATNGSHGHPNLRAMSPAKTDGVKNIWFATNAGSSKVRELLNDGHAVIYASAPRNAGECRFWGSVEVLTDVSSKKKVWKEEYKAHFPDGVSSEDLTVLRFDVSNGIYTNKNMENFEFKN
jgi:general stress protein 26